MTPFHTKKIITFIITLKSIPAKLIKINLKETMCIKKPSHTNNMHKKTPHANNSNEKPSHTNNLPLNTNNMYKKTITY